MVGQAANKYLSEGSILVHGWVYMRMMMMDRRMMGRVICCGVTVTSGADSARPGLRGGGGTGTSSGTINWRITNEGRGCRGRASWSHLGISWSGNRSRHLRIGRHNRPEIETNSDYGATLRIPGTADEIWSKRKVIRLKQKALEKSIERKVLNLVNYNRGQISPLRKYFSRRTYNKR